MPPGWDDPPITHSGEGRWAGAFLTHDSMFAVGMVDRDPKDLCVWGFVGMPLCIPCWLAVSSRRVVVPFRAALDQHSNR